MNERAYYNENDEFAAAWLKNVIARGLIAPGEVDTRSIVDVRPDDLIGFKQCHFFAGIGVWSYAARGAGWTDDRHLWSGSCPCGPFSGAGRKLAFDDPRHLWPEFFRLIRQYRPGVIVGEQVASPPGLAWFDLVQSDLEGEGYPSAAIDICAAGIGAPHIRQRLYWLACAGCEVDGGRGDDGPGQGIGEGPRAAFERSAGFRAASLLVDGISAGLEGYTGNGDDRDQPGRIGAHASRPAPEAGAFGHNGSPGPVNGIWRDADWLFCRDGKWRPVEPGTFPLAHGAPARVGRLRGYGNAIVAPLAQAFIEAVMEVIP